MVQLDERHIELQKYVRQAAVGFCQNRGLPLIDHEVLIGIINCTLAEMTRLLKTKESK